MRINDNCCGSLPASVVADAAACVYSFHLLIFVLLKNNNGYRERGKETVEGGRGREERGEREM